MKIRIRFCKQGNLRYIGHLDIMRYFQKSIRRAGIAIRYSEGFSPHPVMSFAAPLSVGMLSRGEYMDMEADFGGTGEELVGLLNASGVPELTVLSAVRLPDGARNAMSITSAADFTVWHRVPDGDECAFWQDVALFCERDHIPYLKETRKGVKELDLADYIYAAGAVTEGFGSFEGTRYPRLFLRLSSGNRENIKPEQVLDAYFRDRGMSFDSMRFQTEREDLYADEAPEAGHDFRTLLSYGEAF